MTTTTKKDLVSALLDEHGRTFSQELKIPLDRGGPAALFRLLTFALLSSARISHEIAIEAARSLAEKGWTSPQKMAASTWRQRTDTLNRAGYARYDESTSRMLGETCDLLIEKYGGDLRKLREQAGRDPKAERELLKECKGIGDTGVDVFFREVQTVWDEVHPFADERALKAAKRLSLGASAKALAGRASEEDYSRLVAALVRCELENAYEDVKQAAAA